MTDDVRVQAAELARQFGARLVALRDRLGLTQALMSERLGMSVEAYSRLERGRSRPSLETLTAIAMTTDVDLRELLGLDSVHRRDESSDAEPADRRVQLMARVHAGLEGVDDAGLELIWRMVSYARGRAGGGPGSDSGKD